MDAKLLEVRMPHERVEVQWRRRLGHDAEANIVRSRHAAEPVWVDSEFLAPAICWQIRRVSGDPVRMESIFSFQAGGAGGGSPPHFLF